MELSAAVMVPYNVAGGGGQSLDRLGFQVGKKLDILFCVFVGFQDLVFRFVWVLEREERDFDTISNIKFFDDLKLISMECVVQGIIETQHVEALEILLQGLCGVHRERLRVHEICLKNGPNLGNVTSEVRLLCDIEQPEPTWTVKHVGGAMRGAGAEQISVLVRTMVESKASKNVLRLFYALGYKLDHELLRVGFAFHFQRGAQITVTVSSVNKMLKLHATDEAVPVTPGIQLVEVTAPASSETYSEVAAAVSSFCEYLAPYILVLHIKLVQQLFLILVKTLLGYRVLRTVIGSLASDIC
ncbi:hypothetical protein Ddye_013396 [Dipteronia dyeriana]|uniref:Mediator of RNA polymerase II transcription subunit 18 n=1 Tax=Dipteronia dyeriana TaxID=168575 RepID=A0AAD9X694_9ROSI|nr:hypothetical protein Ddye_013396 [Dipteronia dyeriana]